MAAVSPTMELSMEMAFTKLKHGISVPSKDMKYDEKGDGDVLSKGNKGDKAYKEGRDKAKFEMENTEFEDLKGQRKLVPPNTGCLNENNLEDESKLRDYSDYFQDDINCQFENCKIAEREGSPMKNGAIEATTKQEGVVNSHDSDKHEDTENEHVEELIQEVLFPLMCHSDKDEDLWNLDPVKYCRVKYGMLEEFCRVTVEQALREWSIQKMMDFIMQTFTSTPLEPRQKVGALHLVGAIADVLLHNKVYKDQVENMLVNHVFTEFASEHGYLKARACWVVQCFSRVNFQNKSTLAKALELTYNALITDKDLPVRVQSAVTLQVLLGSQEHAKDILKPDIIAIIQELLKIIKEMENDDLACVLQKLVYTYSDQIGPYAVEISTNLSRTFTEVLNSDKDGTEVLLSMVGILDTLELIVAMVAGDSEVCQHMEGIVLELVDLILQENVGDFYVEVLTLIAGLTRVRISERMWKALPVINEIFQKDKFDSFSEFMPALYNYATVDPVTFSSDPKYLEMMFTMCKTVLMGDVEEESECHAVKLLEVILIQYKGQVDSVVSSFVEVALERLTREAYTSELRTMCLQVVVAALCYNPPMLLEILQEMPLPNTSNNESLMERFLSQWLYDTDCFFGLHDRKMCVLGLVALMDTPSTRAQPINEIAQQIIPALLVLFTGLQRLYAYRAGALRESGDEEEEEQDSDSISDGEVEEVEDDNVDEDDDMDEEDNVDEEDVKVEEKGELDDADEDDSDDAESSDDDEDSADGSSYYENEGDESQLEMYPTLLDKEDCPIDEFQVFKDMLLAIEQRDPAWYGALTNHLNKAHKEVLEQVLELADVRKAAADATKIEEASSRDSTT